MVDLKWLTTFNYMPGPDGRKYPWRRFVYRYLLGIHCAADLSRAATVWYFGFSRLNLSDTRWVQSPKPLALRVPHGNARCGLLASCGVNPPSTAGANRHRGHRRWHRQAPAGPPQLQNHPYLPAAGPRRPRSAGRCGSHQLGLAASPLRDCPNARTKSRLQRQCTKGQPPIGSCVRIGGNQQAFAP